MCHLFNVKRSGFYDYLKNRIYRKNELEAELIDWMKKISKSSHFSYGSRRITKALNALGYRIGGRKTRRLMKVAHIFVRYRKKYKVTTNSNHQRPIYENVLQRQFTVSRPNKVYVSDITYVWTQEGWLYLTVMMDIFSRKIVGWNMSSRMTADTVSLALNMAIGLRNPEKGLIVHSDRGSQYASQQYQSLLANYGFIGSMSRKGNCRNNSVAESFFSRLKDEFVFWRNYQTRDEAKHDILNYILMFYNSQRLHSKLGYVSPQQFENNYWGAITKAA